ncbi:MAG: metallophosphoesterase [Daejeonella sp.]
MKRKDFLKASVAAAGLSVLPDLASAKSPAPRKSFRFAFISDIHVKPEKIAEDGMARSLQHIQKLRPKAEFIIMGGDAIYDSLKATREYTKVQWDLYQSILKKENVLPVYNCIGNHDIFGWYNTPQITTDPLYGKAWALKELGLSAPYYHFNKGKWDFIVLDSTQQRPEGGYIAKLDEDQFQWLEKKLAEIPSDHFISIISHIPILSICAGLYFGKNDPNGDLRIQYMLMHTDFFRIKELFNKYPNIKNCLSGHIHLEDEVDYNNVRYFCNGALSGNLWKGPYYEFGPAYALFDFYEDGSCKREMVSYY